MKTKLILALTAIVIALSACKKGKETEPTPEPAKQSIVYAAGYEVDAVTNVRTAMFWKDGKPTVLEPTKNNDVRGGIVVSGNDIYIGASETLVAGKTTMPKYFKNGVAVNLGDGTKFETVNGIAVVGNDVHVIGYEFNATTSRYTAKYWKNGVATKLTADNVSSEANAIAISGNDVYIVGHINSMATYWKNGTPITLSNTPTYAGIGRGISINGTDVYIAGYARNEKIAGYGTAYWKNESLNAIESTATPSASAQGRAIAINGNDIYIIDNLYNSTTKINIPRYWKNGVVTNLSDGTLSATVASLSVVNNDVYIGGYQSNANGTYIATIWKNGVASKIGTDNKDTLIMSMVVK
jgi:hypothetical protein